MKGKKRKSKNPKFRILLDSSFANPNNFPRLSSKCNLAHPIKTFKKSAQISDEDLYKLAIKENRFMLTINYKDFKKLIKPKLSGIICIESQLSNQQIDDTVTKFLGGKNPIDYYGKVLKIPHLFVEK